MFKRLPCLALFLALPAWAHDYPTVDRVEYVLECVRNNGGEYAFMYKCSCAIDEIAKSLTYDEYVEGATVSRYQGMGGERTGVFRDPENMKDIAKRYRSVQAKAREQCGVQK